MSSNSTQEKTLESPKGKGRMTPDTWTMRCHRCGKQGHKQTQCRAGGPSPAGGEKDKALSDAVARADGNAIAASELSGDLKKASESLAAAEAELHVMRTKRRAEVALAFANVCFRVKLSDIADDRHWAWRVLSLVYHVLLYVLAFCAIVIPAGSVAYLAGGWKTPIAAVLYVGFCGWWFWPRRTRWELRATLLSWREDPVDDMRQDAHSLQKLKHALPLLCTWKLERDDKTKPRYLTVSGELLMQVLSGHNQSYIAGSAIVHRRMFDAACRNQTVNVPKTILGQSVHNNTALVAWICWQSQQSEKLLDFAIRPHQ